MTTLRSGAATDLGRVREINEDRFLHHDEVVFAVADGVGGHQAGEVASQTAVDTLRDTFTEQTADGLVGAIHRANRQVWQLAQESPDRRGMGTTLVALAVVAEDGIEQLAVANVGDSRAYLYSATDLIQLTRDHSLVEEMVREGRLSAEEALVHPQRSIITRALGMEAAIEVDLWLLLPSGGDRLLLCSDGLTNELSDSRIAATLRRIAEPQEAADELVRQARAQGGGDNITAVVVDVVDDDARSEKASEVMAGATEARRHPRLTPAATATAPVPASCIGFDDDFVDGGPGDIPEGEDRFSASGGGVGFDVADRQETRVPGFPLRGGPSGPQLPVARSLSWRVGLFVAVLATILVAAVLAVRGFAYDGYFVKIQDDSAAIFQGRRDGLLGFEPRPANNRRPTIVSDLDRAGRDQLEGTTFATVSAAKFRIDEVLRQSRARTSPPPTTPLLDASSTTLVPVPFGQNQDNGGVSTVPGIAEPATLPEAPRPDR